MVIALERAIAAAARPALRELGGPDLACALVPALGEFTTVRLVGDEQLKSRVFRLRWQTDRGPRSLVAKWLSPEHARRNELAILRWLPDLELEDLAPALLGTAAGRDGLGVWHVYEDLGPFELDARDPDRARVTAAVVRIAELHVRAAAHPLLAECRLHGEPRGPGLLATTACDAARALEALRPPHVQPSAAQATLRDRLLARLADILADAPARARAVSDWGGPETLQHGDLWTTNTFVAPGATGFRVRLIDWDRMGVGSASYDLSTFLLRFAPEHREWIMTAYREALDGTGMAWRLPARHELNRLFETWEWTRYANRLIWPALAIRREGAPWGFDELAAVERWFQALQPVLPEASA